MKHLRTLWLDLQDDNSDLRFELRSSAIPLLAFLLDAAQYNAATFTLGIRWPVWVGVLTDWFGKIFLFQFPLEPCGYHLLFHLYAVAVVVSAVPVTVPTQTLFIVLGDHVAQALFMVGLLLETAGMMPGIRFMMNSISCPENGPMYLDDTECLDPLHMYYVLMSVLLLFLMLYIFIKWEMVSSNPVEQAKFDRVYLMSSRDTLFDYVSVTLKVLFTLPISIMEPWLTTSQKVLFLLIVCAMELANMVVYKPFYNVKIMAALTVPLVVACANNIASLLLLALPEEIACPVIVAYVVLIPPGCYLLYKDLCHNLVLDRIRKILDGLNPYKKPSHIGLGGSARVDILDAKMQKAYFRKKRDRKDSKRRRTHAIDLDRMMIGVTQGDVLKFADLLRRVRMHKLSMRFNEYTVLNLSTLQVPILSSSRETLEELDLSCNRTMFVKGMNEVSAIGPLAASNSSPLTALISPKSGGKRGGMSRQSSFGRASSFARSTSFMRRHSLSPRPTPNGGESLWSKHRFLISALAALNTERLAEDNYQETKEVNAGETTHRIFDGLKLLDPCGGLDMLIAQCNNLRKLNLSRTYLPFRVFKRLVSAILESNIAELDLSETHLGYAHSFFVAKLIESDRLTTLNLRYNRLGPRGAKLIAKALRKCTKLKRLDVGWNDIGVDGVEAIVRSVERFIDIRVQCNAVPREVFKRVNDQLQAALAEFKIEEGLVEKPGPSLDEILKGRTIYELLGGQESVNAVVERFYFYMVADPRLSKFFKNVSMGRMRHLQGSFVAHALGSTVPYKGKDMKSAHAKLGITHDDFDGTCAWLFLALEEVAPDLPKAVTSTIAAVVFSLRDVVVTRDLDTSPMPDDVWSPPKSTRSVTQQIIDHIVDDHDEDDLKSLMGVSGQTIQSTTLRAPPPEGFAIESCAFECKEDAVEVLGGGSGYDTSAIDTGTESDLEQTELDETSICSGSTLADGDDTPPRTP
mmetsp:Transcript_22093/g.67871  ORF Transcript_22093/g.67871 Transcript_22093/m.67871 type:complete len:972 (-) Transcript_22093:861-3776(-)|eukprot:CAMPEP_0118850806 /NCGR_PEP_ID=MMETSP1163-20130328/494_1 /TAXON_ID=124430 /ORGANISM="Phaeomonas parva, Strain CCMP2877" /LENGTH=971 /DNA_ID=CAMNT_0006783041 /DNA_START=380 /DNA_END=3295 /DNA_ORIENTATION=-